VSASLPTADRYVQRLRAGRRVTADGRLATYRGVLAVLRDVVVDFARCSGRPGGEPLEQVWGQAEADEFCRFQPGFLHLAGARLPRLRWRRPRLRRPALQAVLDTLGGPGPAAPPAAEPRPHVLVIRFEYANFFHAMTDWYNVFLVQRLLGAGAPRVVLADGHPASSLDAVWSGLFGDVVRIGALGPAAIRLDTLALAPLGYDSPLLAWRARALPLAAEFRRFVLERHGLPGADGPRRPGPLQVTLVRREDYAAHPRNPTGRVQRKLANEPVLLQVLRTLADVEVRAVALERLPFGEQLALVAATDVLVGMHGAGLTHALFLPPWAGLVELFPDYFSPRSRHFRRIAEWRGLFYAAWQNRQHARERPDHQTEVPPAVVVDALRRYAYRAGSRL
jgi:glycoprotein 2-beta-D-xylosyltransferase